MGKSLYIAEKPSVAQEFAKALHINTQRKDGYLESAEAIVTWCVGHLVTMSYPEEYDPALKRWSLETLPFIPQEFKYEVIPAVSKQFRIVSGLLNRADVDTIYVCTDSGREGEYIYRLVEQQAGVTGPCRRKGQEPPPRMDRLPDRRRDPARDPRSKRLKRIRQPGSFRLLKSERRLPDGNQLLPPPDIKIRQQHLQLPEYEIFRRICRPRYDLRPRHGRAQRTGDPGIRRDPVLQSPKHHRRERCNIRRRMARRQRIKMVRILRPL